MEWDEVRRLFPATERFTYLNAAEASPLPVLAANEAKTFYDRMQNEGDLPWDEWLEKRERVREKTAELISATKAEIAFTQNTSQGMNLVASILKNDFGGYEVVTMEDEFPSSTLPWLNLGYKLRFVTPEGAAYPIEKIDENITPETKILVTSHVQYRTGFKQDLVELGKLCKEKELIFVVNATQSAGAMKIDVKKANIDFLVFSGLKWPMAGYGIGVLFVSKRWLGEAYPVAGWQSVKDPYAMDNKRLELREEASAFELGCPHFPNIFALGGSLDLLNKIGKDNVEQRIYELGDYLVERLEKLYGLAKSDTSAEIISPLERKHRSGITIVKCEAAEEIVQKLRARDVIISARGEGLRISVHVYNNEEDVDRLVAELQRVS